MVAFDVKDMTCGHCVATITKAVQAADNAATVRIDLPNHRVEIDSPNTGAARLQQVISEAGYSPKPVPAPN